MVLQALFMFALVWSVGATTNEEGRKMFDGFLRAENLANKASWPFPKHGQLRYTLHSTRYLTPPFLYIILSTLFIYLFI